MKAKYEWPEHYLDRFFSRMETIWPGWGNGVNKQQWRIEWRAVLEQMDPQKINDTINLCRDEYTHKPSFKEFKCAYAILTGQEREYFVAPERPPEPPSASQAVNGYVDTLLSALRAPTVRRDVPPSREYAAAIANAKKAGCSLYAVDLEFLPQAGWSLDRERQYLHDVSVIAYGNHRRFFEYGHAPESIEWALQLIHSIGIAGNTPVITGATAVF